MNAGDVVTRAKLADNKGPLWCNLSFLFLPPEEDEAHEIETVLKLASSSVQAAKAAPEPESVQTSGSSWQDMSLRDAVERMLELLLKFSSMACSCRRQIDPVCRIPVTQRDDLEPLLGSGKRLPMVGQLNLGA